MSFVIGDKQSYAMGDTGMNERDGFLNLNFPPESIFYLSFTILEYDKIYKRYLSKAKGTWIVF